MPPAAELFSPILLYIACALGAVGVILALPRRGLSPQVLGGMITAAAVGGIFLAVSIKSVAHLPNFNFYIFSFIALGSALRVISHPRPVYAALYFILAILASCGLYVLLSAEFLAFALVIVYAGAILITYLFVIMLATESPTAEAPEALADYDKYSREPMLATVAGFVLVATLTTIMARGAGNLPAPTFHGDPDAKLLASLPKKVEKALREAHDPADPTKPLLQDGERLAQNAQGGYSVDVVNRTATVVKSDAPGHDGPTRVVKLPADLTVYNVEGVAFTLLNDHPGSIEIAGVILLMAMLGAVVLARKKVEIDEQRVKAAGARLIVVETPTGVKA